MSTLIVAFPKIEEAKAVRNLLVRKGYEVAIPCITGAQVINQADNLSDGIVCAAMPIKVNDLCSTIEMMLQAQVRRRRKLRSQPRRRSPQEQKIIDDAKAILMERNNMSEPEAFRYIQKCSMDSGNTMVESAQMVISIYDGG